MAARNKLKAVLVGVGPGSPALVTPEAREILSRAEIILGWEFLFEFQEVLVVFFVCTHQTASIGVEN